MDIALSSDTDKHLSKESQPQEHWVDGVLKAEDRGSFTDISTKVSSLPKIVNSRVELPPTMDTSKSPSYWSTVCLHNMALLAKEATTVRRVLEPLFHSFDAENYWSSEKGLACSVLTYLQSLLEESGGNSHLLVSILLKHLDHKNVAKQPLIQMYIVDIAAHLAQNAKQQASAATISAITDLIKYLRKSMQYSAESSTSGDDSNKWNSDLQSAIENCILRLSIKVSNEFITFERLKISILLNF
ncbi:unnamed protein product [Ilex paraguariensis]|uniref:Uncharacterized protein n=1 Tax=Ilex paraguariensis TaxID=185542 RepID=A0ABC8UI22_9AQUA